MDYGPAPESRAEAMDWIASHGGRFGHYIGGGWTKPGGTFDTRNPATGETLAEIAQGTSKDVDDAVAAARKAQKGWAALPGHKRARVLYALARIVQKQSRLFSVLESLDNGKPIREARDIDIPLVARHFYYFHAGMAELQGHRTRQPRAPWRLRQIIPWNFPSCALLEDRAGDRHGQHGRPEPGRYTSLTALLFADYLPRGGRAARGSSTSSPATGRRVRPFRRSRSIDKSRLHRVDRVGTAASAKRPPGLAKALTLELAGNSPYIVFDDATSTAPSRGWSTRSGSTQGQVCCRGARGLLVQEGIAETFHARLRDRMDKPPPRRPARQMHRLWAPRRPGQFAAADHSILSRASGGEGLTARADRYSGDGLVFIRPLSSPASPPSDRL